MTPKNMNLHRLILNSAMFLSLTALVSPSAMATLAQVNFTGTITNYEYGAGGDLFGGSIGAGTTYSANYAIDPNAFDRNFSSTIGDYAEMSVGSYTANVGGNIFQSNSTFVTIFDNFDPFATGFVSDSYEAWSIKITHNELLIMSLKLGDSTGTALLDDSLVTGPDLTSFDIAGFQITSFGINGSSFGHLYTLFGDVNNPGSNTVAVSEPSTLFLLGLALLGFGVTQTLNQRKQLRRQELIA